MSTSIDNTQSSIATAKFQFKQITNIDENTASRNGVGLRVDIVSKIVENIMPKPEAERDNFFRFMHATSSEYGKLVSPNGITMGEYGLLEDSYEDFQSYMQSYQDQYKSAYEGGDFESIMNAYTNFQAYLQDRNLKEENLSSEEIGFYALKANDVTLPSGIATIDQYQQYKAYVEAYDKELSSVIDPDLPGNILALGWMREGVGATDTGAAKGMMKDGLATLMTGLGEARIIFDLNDSNTIDNRVENLRADQLLTLDSNRDGFLDSADVYFDKLKFVMKDDNGNDKIVKASSIMSSIDLGQFMDQEKVAQRKQHFVSNKEMHENKWQEAQDSYVYDEKKGTYSHYEESSGKKLIATNTSGYRGSAVNPFMERMDPKHTHKLFGYEEANNYFGKFADSSGWVDLRKDFGTVGVFSEYLNFAYKKTDANGNEYLQRFNSYDGTTGIGNKDLSSLQTQKFNAFYSEYMKLKEVNDAKNTELASKLEGNSFGVDADSISGFKSAEMRALEKDFEESTGLSFSMDNLQKVKSLVDQGKSLQAFKDMDEVVAMRKNEDGTFTLKFNTGRTVEVKELYYDTGDFVTLEGDTNKRASLLMNDELKPLDKNNDDQIDKSEIDFNNYAIEREGKLQTLQDAGINSINLIRGGPQGKDYYMEMVFNDNNKDDSYQTLYKLTDLNNPYKKDAMEKLKEYLNHPYQQNTLEEEKAKVYEGRG